MASKSSFKRNEKKNSIKKRKILLYKNTIYSCLYSISIWSYEGGAEVTGGGLGLCPRLLDSFWMQSSMVSGKGLPPVSGSIKDKAADSKALEPNKTVGIWMLTSANVPTKLARMPPTRATSEQEPKLAFLKIHKNERWTMKIKHLDIFTWYWLEIVRVCKAI